MLQTAQIGQLEKLVAKDGVLDKIQAERCKRSFFYFMQTFWPIVSASEPVWNWHIEYLCDQLQKIAERVGDKKPKENDVIINIPPGSTKSVCCTIMFPVWCWTRWHWMQFITGSYSGDLSEEHSGMSREIIRSERFKTLFPELEIKSDQDTKSNYRIQKNIFDKNHQLIGIEIGGARFSTSVGGMVTGQHADIIIVDDPINPAQATSPASLLTANKWFDQTLSTRKRDKAVTPTILVMQRLHQNDPTGHLLSKSKSIFHICLPGEIRNYDKQVNPKELKDKYVNGLLDCARLSESVLKELETDLGQYGYAGQIGQSPVPAGGGMFKHDKFEVIELNQLPSQNQIVSQVRWWDKAGTKGAGCYTAGVKMIKTKQNKFIVVDVIHGQWSSDKREDIIKETAELDGKETAVWVEMEPGSGGKESAENTVKNLAGFIINAERPVGDKVYRADPYSVQVNYGNVMLLRAGWNEPFIKEHEFFPNGKYKDQVDAAAGAFSKLTNKKQVWIGR